MPTKKRKPAKKATSRKSTASAKKKLAAAGKKIMTEAKKLYKASGKKTKWQTCVARAAKKLK